MTQIFKNVTYIYISFYFSGLGCFSNIDIQIDTALNGGPSDYEVTYKVKELKRLSGAINTLMGNQEGSIQVGLKSPNVLGQGERFQVDYSYGTKKTNQFNFGISKPLHNYTNKGSIPSLNISGGYTKLRKYFYCFQI